MERFLLDLTMALVGMLASPVGSGAVRLMEQDLVQRPQRRRLAENVAYILLVESWIAGTIQTLAIIEFPEGTAPLTSRQSLCCFAVSVAMFLSVCWLVVGGAARFRQARPIVRLFFAIGPLLSFVVRLVLVLG